MNPENDTQANSHEGERPAFSPRMEWAVRGGLILFGLLIGLGALEIGLRILQPVRKGSEFDSIADLRRSMLTNFENAPSQDAAAGDSAFSAKAPSGSVSLGAIIQPNPSDEIIYDLRPRISVTFQGQPVTTNSCGMRGPEYPLAKPANTYRIALLGDSFAFGWGVKEQQGFGAALERILNEVIARTPLRPGQQRQRVEVLNFGVPGYSTFQQVAAFAETGVDFDPDAVMVFFIENDFGLPFYIRDIVNPHQLLPSLSLARVAGRVLSESEEASIKATPFDPNRALRKLADITSAQGIPLYLAINPRKNWRGMLSRLWVAKKSRDITVMDLRDNFLRRLEQLKLDDEALNIPNDGHPTPAKHQLFAEAMAPYFLARLPSPSFQPR